MGKSLARAWYAGSIGCVSVLDPEYSCLVSSLAISFVLVVDLVGWSVGQKTLQGPAEQSTRAIPRHPLSGLLLLNSKVVKNPSPKLLSTLCQWLP